jgi:hypothetical protein
LVLAVATFASVRSANRSARVAEEALLEQRRPILAQSRFDDPIQKIMFVERRWVRAQGGRGVAEHVNGNIYLAMSLRNVGTGIAVCQGWAVASGEISTGRRPEHLPDAEFRAHTRDLYIPAGDLGMWQGAIRDPDEPAYAGVRDAIDAGEGVLIELLYSDQVGEQRTITRFALAPYTSEQSGEVNWTVSTVRHWFLDRPGPRSERDIQARAEHILARIETGAPAGAAMDAETAAAGEAAASEIAGRAEDPAGTGEPVSTEDPVSTGEPVSVIARPSCE